MKKNIYFVQANNVYGNDKKSTYIPYAAGCIMAYCLKNKKIASEYDFKKIIYSRKPVDEVVSSLDNPFMVLFSCSVWNMEYNKTLAAKIKRSFPGCYIVFGGHNISPDGKTMEDLSYVDFLTHRFGEEPTEGILLNLAEGKPFDETANISFRTPDGKVITTHYESQTGTDYPSPYLEGVFDEILKDDISFSGLFESNRGCPNSCSFCDWSSLKDKVRLFPIERVYAEIDWFVKNKIEYIYCTDGNFCLFDRDADIADYVVSCKEKYGYPQIFKAFFTKNRFNFVFDVSTRFFNSGLDKAKTISFQSLNPVVLKNIGRRNISTDMFRDLMKKYDELNISTFSELILGLPGETYTSFCQGVNTLIENGQHYAINIYPCEILPNAEMGKKSYQEKFSIKSTKVPFRLIHSDSKENINEITEYSEYITATDTMNEKEWARALLFSSYVQALHNLGLLRFIAIYVKQEKNTSYDKFYNDLITYSENQNNTLLGSIYKKVNNLCEGVIKGSNELVCECDGTGNILWGFDELIYLEFYKQLDTFYKEIMSFIRSVYGKSKITQALVDYQHKTVKKIGCTNVTIESDYDFYSYFSAAVSNRYEPLKNNKILLKIHDNAPVNTLIEFARETVWYGRNRRATDYTSTNYNIIYHSGDL